MKILRSGTRLAMPSLRFSALLVALLACLAPLAPVRGHGEMR